VDRHVLLIGFMGAGKSSVSAVLHGMLGVGEADTDKMIEQKEGLTVDEIFALKGEKYFRDCETQLLKELAALEPMVISCGGGMPLRPENAALMKQAGLVILLTASPDTILKRIKDDDSRPLLSGHKNTAYISQIMQQRWMRYEAAADMMVATDGRTIGSICEEIARYVAQK